jgi:anti-sigma B factor antagonist
MTLEVKVVEKESGVYVITPVGDITTETYKKLDDTLTPIIAGQLHALVLDLKGVSYISSMGLGVLFRTKQLVNAKGASVMIINPQARIKDVFETVKFMPDHMFADLAQADEYLDKFLDALQKGKIKSKKNLY